jgi:hypothetical protein
MMATEEPDPFSPHPADPSTGPDEPRLGILHLLAWTACVAVYLGVQRIAGQRLDDPTGPFGGTYNAVIATLGSIACGAALGGLILWGTRRWRGLAFPKHPGEYLLVVTGLHLALEFSTALLPLPTQNAQDVRLAFALGFGLGLLQTLVLMWPLLVVDIRRWRAYFATLLAAKLLYVFFFGMLLLPSTPPLSVLGGLSLVWLVLDMASVHTLVNSSRKKLVWTWMPVVCHNGGHGAGTHGRID